MKKPKSETTRWIDRLRSLMLARGFNPRSLSLEAGLNPTAVRDMLEGRTRFPRYDTAMALSQALGVTPSQLMSGTEEIHAQNSNAPKPDDDLELLTEIIARLHEVAENYEQKLKPQDFAAMVTTIYRQVKHSPRRKGATETALHPKIHDLLAYESLRHRSKNKKI